MGTRVWPLVHPSASIATACVAGQEGSHATHGSRGIGGIADYPWGGIEKANTNVEITTRGEMVFSMVRL